MREIKLYIKEDDFIKRLEILAKSRDKAISELILEIVKKHISASKVNERLHYNKLNPEQYIYRIKYEISEDENLNDVHPFSNIKDTTKFARELRDRAWDRKCKKVK